MNITINADTVSIVGACIAFASMAIALTSAVISGRNLRLQRAIHSESSPNFSMTEILDSYAIFDNSNKSIKLMFYPLIVNMSSKPMILKRIRLELIGEEQSIILCPAINSACINDGHNIAGNNADTSWICFEINQDTYKSLKVLKHELIIEDAFNNLQKVSTAWVKEMVEENERV